MIFVTVGTHEQQFNRLVKYIDDLKANGMINEEVFIQTGYSTYEPKNCKWSQFYSYQNMIELVKRARIVITHGGPSSFMMPLQMGKIPIVVPRKKDFQEHINNHQLEFCKIVAERQGNILLVDSIDELYNTIKNYNNLVEDMPAETKSNNKQFNERLERIVDDLFT